MFATSSGSGFGAFTAAQPTSLFASGTPVAQEKPSTNVFGGGSLFGQPKPSPAPQSQNQEQAKPKQSATSTSSGIFDDKGNRQKFLEDFMKNFLLGEELVDTQFHLYSARSQSGRITKPRVLCANNVILSNSSKYFLDLLSSDVNPSDTSLSDLTDGDEVPNDALIEDYGYESDSDLEDDDLTPDVQRDSSLVLSPSGLKTGAEIQPKESDELSDVSSESVRSEEFVVTPGTRVDEQTSANTKEGRSATSNNIAAQETLGCDTSANKKTMRLKSLRSRHVLVKDTAFRTWYTLLYYISTGKVKFLPLSSVAPRGQPECSSSTSSPNDPSCSAKSMYRLACKVGQDQLRDAALAHIRSSLGQHNILKEISGSLVSKHAQLLEMELDVLYLNIASPPVVAGFPTLVQRVNDGELPHGTAIIVGIHSRFLKTLHPSLAVPKAPIVPPPSSVPPSLTSQASVCSPPVAQPEPGDRIEDPSALSTTEGVNDDCECYAKKGKVAGTTSTKKKKR